MRKLRFRGNILCCWWSEKRARFHLLFDMESEVWKFWEKTSGSENSLKNLMPVPLEPIIPLLMNLSSGKGTFLCLQRNVKGCSWQNYLSWQKKLEMLEMSIGRGITKQATVCIHSTGYCAVYKTDDVAFSEWPKWRRWGAWVWSPCALLVGRPK